VVHGTHVGPVVRVHIGAEQAEKHENQLIFEGFQGFYSLNSNLLYSGGRDAIPTPPAHPAMPDMPIMSILDPVFLIHMEEAWLYCPNWSVVRLDPKEARFLQSVWPEPPPPPLPELAEAGVEVPLTCPLLDVTDG
jgi:hypothetical protein